jgi:hypothetical protein
MTWAYNSCVNDEIRRFNSRLIQVVDKLNKVTIVNAELGCFTRLGFHCNKKSKMTMAEKISVIQEITGSQEENVIIPLKWEQHCANRQN